MVRRGDVAISTGIAGVRSMAQRFEVRVPATKEAAISTEAGAAIPPNQKVLTQGKAGNATY